ncbi:MAG: hypothetical protein GY861_18095 [bacterium]|nr:hypothetical protein [bacterium]
MALTKEQLLQAYKDGKIKDKATLTSFVMFKDLEDNIDNELPAVQKIMAKMKVEPKMAKSELIAIIKSVLPKVEDGKTPTDQEIEELIKPLLPKVKDGKAPTKEDLIKLIKPLIPQIDEDQIATRVTKAALKELEQLIPSIDTITDEMESKLPVLGEKFRDGLEILQDDERLDVSAIKGLDEYENIVKLSKQPKIGGGSTARNFYQLFDVPQAYGGHAGKALRVNTAETGLEFFTGSGLIEWGEIGGTVTDQTDLTTYLSTNYVPYTGANANVNLGAYDLAATDLTSTSLTGGMTKDVAGLLTTAIADTDYQQPITWGDGLEYAAGTAKIDHNTTNLKITATEINTIQDIDVTATPSFNGVTLTGNSLVTSTNELQFRDSALSVYSSADGFLTLKADSRVEVESPIFSTDERLIVHTGSETVGTASYDVASMGGSLTSGIANITYKGFNLNTVIYPNANDVTAMTCFYAAPTVLGTGTHADTRGIYVGPILVAGDFTNVDGIIMAPNFTSGTVGTYKGLNLKDKTGGTTPTTGYQIFVEKLTATNPYEIWMDSTSAMYFRDTAIHIASLNDGRLDLTADVAIDLNTANVLLTGDLGITGTRVTKGWFTDLEVTNAIAADITGNAATATALETARTIGGVSFDGTANITVASATGGFDVTGGNLTVAEKLDVGQLGGALGSIIRAQDSASQVAYNALAGGCTNINPINPMLTLGLSFIGTVEGGSSGTPMIIYAGGMYTAGRGATAASSSTVLNIATGFGVRTRVDSAVGSGASGSCNIVTAYGVEVENFTVANGGTIGTATAFYDAGQTRGGTANWGLGINTANNYINGALSVGKNTTPGFKLDVAGDFKATGYSQNIVAKTAAYTATTTDDVITCGAGNETFTIDLPAVVSGKVYTIKNVGTGVITVDADTTGSTTIDGSATITLSQYDSIKLICDASVYWII